MTLLSILLLYMAFRLKQLTCDFFLQTSWMALNKGMPGHKDGTRALLTHAGIHAIFTLLLMLLFVPHLWWMCFVDFIVHTTVDKVKAVITYKYGWTYNDTAYWWALGIDQEAHNLTHLAYIVIIVYANGGML